MHLSKDKYINTHLINYYMIVKIVFQSQILNEIEFRRKEKKTERRVHFIPITFCKIRQLNVIFLIYKNKINLVEL